MAAIGIDLGTTYSSACFSADGKLAKILQNQEGQNITPSVVFFQDTDGAEEPLVGTMAKNAAASAPYNVVQFIKREMGNPNFIYTSPNGTDFKPEEISAIILKYIKQYSQQALGEEICDAVITVPAYFDDARRTATKQAGKIAGLNVLQVFNEPTAAAIAYGLDSKEKGRVLVYDLGGGTFDITLMDIDDGQFNVIATDGDANLGGFDFDRAIVDLIIEDLKNQGCVVDEYDDMLYSEIREKAEILKRGLSNVEQSNALFTIDGKNYKVRITRNQFEQASKTLLLRTQERLEVLLENQNCDWSEIDHLLMIGGSTRMPMVKNMLENISGRKLKYEIDPDIAVAYGAGIYANHLSDKAKGLPGADDKQIVKIEDVTSQSLGVIALDDNKKEFNSIIIQNNSNIPCKQTQVYSTVQDNQTEIRVQVTEGNDSDVEYVKIIGEQVFKIAPYPKGAPVAVTFAYDIDQTIFVEIEDLTTHESLGTFDIDRIGNLTNDEVDNLTEKIQVLNID